jgi:lysophospholipase L1-like esterase
MFRLRAVDKVRPLYNPFVMAIEKNRASGDPKGLRRFLFVGVAVALGVAVGLALIEFGVGAYINYVSSREQMDPGFLVFEPELGWQMAPNWNGRHRHHDFDVRYSTNSRGLRGRWPEPEAGTRRYVFVGDSFTFGLGANDDETFVQRLGGFDPASVYLNAGVAGYSTDQEYLFLQRHLREWRADEVIVVVYLANDLLDNNLRYPLQASMGKPLFIVDGGESGLRLTNVPVPLEPKPPEEQNRTLATMVLGEDGARKQASSWRSRWQLARILGFSESAGSTDLAGMPGRLADPVDLFVRLTQNIRQLCMEGDVRLRLILMPGRSYIELPNSLSAHYQDFVRGAILARQADLGVRVIDLASALRDERKKGEKNLFHPNEGHLTARGHQVVADVLRSRLSAAQ